MSEHLEERRSQVLVVEDEAVNRQILGHILSARYDVLCAENGVEAMQILSEKRDTIALIMLDLLMPRMDGYEFLKIRQRDERLRLIPVIVLTSEEQSELTTLQLGATDFLKKPYDMPEVILARADRLVELTNVRRVIRSTECDPLTGLYTRQYFLEYVQQREYAHPGLRLDVAVLDIDAFHLVNETFGRETGDRILRAMADILREHLDRIGGMGSRSDRDRFYLCFPHGEEYGPLLEELEEQLNSRIPAPELHMRLGVVPAGEEEIPIGTRCERAEYAVERAGEKSGPRVAVYDDEMHASALFVEQLLREVDYALLDGQIRVYYQPVFSIAGEKPVLKGAEALVRWLHPEKGMLEPEEFVPLLEKNGRIEELDDFVWRTAAAQVCDWRGRSGAALPVSVNVSRTDLCDPMLEARLTEILDEYALMDGDFMLEIPEDVCAADPAHMTDTLERLRTLGFSIALDDFGVSRASLSLLKTLPIDVLKLDPAMIGDIDTDERSFRVAEAAVVLAHHLSVSVTAEGVEEEQQCARLRSCGCDAAEGWLFAEAMPAEEFERYL